LGGNIQTVKEKAEALIVASKDIGIEENADKTKYMFLLTDQNAGQSRSTKIDYISPQSLEEFKYFGTTLT
jgi:hypothetical protein